MHLTTANILQGFDDKAVGTKVTDREGFLSILETAIEGFDFAGQTTPGQGLITLPDAAKATVSAGVGRHVDDPNAYVLRSWRGSVNAYLKREHAAEVEGVAAVVYTVDAYLSDPDVAGDLDEVERIKTGITAGYYDAAQQLRELAVPITHVLVAVLAFAGPKAPLSPGRLVSNLAGGNKDALAWDADTIREKARESAAYAAEWGVVAD